MTVEDLISELKKFPEHMLVSIQIGSSNCSSSSRGAVKEVYYYGYSTVNIRVEEENPYVWSEKLGRCMDYL